MKLSAVAVLAAALSAADAFSPSSIKAGGRRASTSLAMSGGAVDRRAFASSAAAVAVGAAGFNPDRALALGFGSENYTPKYDDLKQIYGLGVTLDNLAAKVADEDKWGSALEGLRLFNKDANFYPGYARNFVSKSVKFNADGDARVGYIRQASSQIGSIQELLEGRQGLQGSQASEEAVKRVRNAQRLIAKFLAESGIEDEKVAAYISAHP